MTKSMQGNFSAMLYFVLATAFMVGVMTFVCVQILPTYIVIMRDFDMRVPWVTEHFIAAANFLKSLRRPAFLS